MEGSESIPIAVIGGGVIGLAVSINLAKKFGRNSVYLFEGHSALGEEQSGRNSGVIHSGIYYEPGSLKASLCVYGNYLLKEYCYKHLVPWETRGKLILSNSKKDDDTLEFYKDRALQNGVSDAQLISKEKINSLEPNVLGKLALYVPTAGVIDTSSYVRRLGELAEVLGVVILKNNYVSDVVASSGGVCCRVQAGNVTYEFNADLLINAAGLRADKIAKMINSESPYEIQPIRGEYAVFNQNIRDSINTNGLNIYRTPQYVEREGRKYFVVGVHLTPTFEMKRNGKIRLGNTILVGPTADVVTDISDYQSRLYCLDYFLEEIKPIFPGLELDDLSFAYCGIRAKLKTPKDDFVIKKDDKYPNCINVMADSPGLTSSLAIAKYLEEKVL